MRETKKQKTGFFEHPQVSATFIITLFASSVSAFRGSLDKKHQLNAKLPSF